MSESITAVVADLGCLLPDRYSRVADYAARIGVPAGALVALLTGAAAEARAADSAAEAGAADSAAAADSADTTAEAYLPAAAAARLRAAVEVRRAADRGEVAWPEAMRVVLAAFEDVFDQPWDARGYQAHLANGPGPALRLARASALVHLDRRLPVLCVATVPAELAPGVAGLLDLTLPVQASGSLGCARPDPAVWRRALAGAGLADHWRTAMVVCDDAASAAALAEAHEPPAESWHLTEDTEAAWLARLADLTG